MIEQSKNIAVGLDIGTTKIVAIVGEKNELGKLNILGLGKSKSTGVYRGVVNNIGKTIQSIQKAIKFASEVSGINIKRVTVGIAGEHIRSLQHSDYITRKNAEQEISKSDLQLLEDQVKKLHMKPGEEIIHVLPQEYKVDGQTGIKESPIGMYGNRLEAQFHVVIGQVSLIRNIVRCVKNSGLELDGITLEPLASAKAVLHEDELEAGVALMDIGGGTTDLAIFKDKTIKHTAVIPYGGNIITEDIKEACLIIHKNAEQIKIRFGSAWPLQDREDEIVSVPGVGGRENKEISLLSLSEIIKSRVTDIIKRMFIEIQKYGYEEPKNKLIAGIVITGGGANLKHIKQLTQYLTGLDVKIGFPVNHLASGTPPELSTPEYATAIGLLLIGLEHSEAIVEDIFSENLEPKSPQEDLNQKEIKLGDEIIQNKFVEDNQKTSKKFSNFSFSKVFDKFTNMLKED